MRTAIPDKWPNRFAVDASVAVAFAWREPTTASADHFFANVQKQWAQLIAPDFWLVECANACWKRAHRRIATPEEVLAAYASILSLPVTAIDTTLLNDIALSIAVDVRITAYDALYVATAQFAGVPLVTGDTRLVKMLKDAAWEGTVFHISEW